MGEKATKLLPRELQKDSKNEHIYKGKAFLSQTMGNITT